MSQAHIEPEPAEDRVWTHTIEGDGPHGVSRSVSFHNVPRQAFEAIHAEAQAGDGATWKSIHVGPHSVHFFLAKGAA